MKSLFGNPLLLLQTPRLHCFRWSHYTAGIATYTRTAHKQTSLKLFVHKHSIRQAAEHINWMRFYQLRSPLGTPSFFRFP